MKNYGKKLLQYLVVMVLTIALAATFIPISIDAAAGNADGTISRVEWLRGLIGLFDMTVEEDNYPDNYFSDISSADSCYRDIMVATEFGLVDVEEGFDMRPDDSVTREFAAYTMNVCLGYVLEEADTYTFSDQDAFTYYGEEIAESYYQAAQVALTRGWMTLVNGTFAPQTNLTQEEKSAMWSDAQESIASKVIDENYDNKVTFAKGVIEVPEGTKFELEEYDTGTFVTLFDYNGLIADGDTFALWVNGLPAVYKAVAVEDMGDSLVIQITEGDENSAIQELDAQGTAEADLATAVQEGEGTMTWIAGGTEEKNYEDGREVRDPRAAGSIPIKAIKRSIPIKLQGGLSATLNVTVPKPTVEYKINGIKEVYVALNADTTVSATVKGNMIDNLGLPRSINIVYIPIGGIGEASISVSVAASGQCSVNYNFDAVAGIHYRKGNGTSLVSSFKKRSFTVSAQAELSATLTATLGVTKVPKVDASIWAKIGPRMGLSAWTYGDGKKPATCMDTYGYVYAGAGATLRIFGKDYSPRPYEIWTKQNSPVRVAAHYEDSVRTSACTRDASQRRYYTRDTSKYFSDGSGIYDSTGSSGSGTVIQPRYEYSLDKNNKDQEVATITKYYGSVSAIVIPNTIDGYPVVAIGSQAFARNSYLQTVLIPDSITLIGQQAFAECTNLETVTLPSSLERLEERAFYNDDMLTGIEIPKSLKETSFTGESNIGPFNGCDGLKNIGFEQGTTKIASGLFANYPGIESIVIPNTVTDIEDYAFYGSKNLQKVTLPESVTRIGNNAFQKCTGLISVMIPDSVAVIGQEAFAECTNLETVTLSSNLGRLDERAFYNDDKLTSIEIPKSLKETSFTGQSNIGPFNSCDGLKNISFEPGTTKIASGLFANCPGIESIDIPDTVTDMESYAFYGSKNLQEVTLPESVTSIGSNAFQKCTGLTNVMIPDSVTVIGQEAFAECTNLETVTLPSNLERLEERAFYNDDKLTSIEIPKGLKETSFTGESNIGPFNGCDGLKNIGFGQGTTKIASGLFANCTGIKSIVIPDTVTDIEFHAFYGSKNLREVTLPESVTSIGSNAFEKCTGLINILIPKGVTEIGQSAFAACTNLESIQLPDSITDITDYMFQNCTALKNIAIPKSITKIGSYAFRNCTALTELDLGKEITEIGDHVFYGCDALSSIVIPDSVTSIGGYCFEDCDVLQKVSLGTGITEIPEGAFYQCGSLEKIVLPYRVSRIRTKAFTNCTKLTSITIPRSVTVIGDNVFSYPGKLTIYGVSGTYAQTYAKEKGISFVPKEVHAKSVALSSTTLKLNKGNTAILALSVEPADFTDEVTWKSTDASVAAADESGMVTAKGVGTATIRVIVGNISADCKVTVGQPVTSISLNEAYLSLEASDTYQLTASIDPTNADNKEVEWISSDETVAAVDQTGLVTALAKGEATITALAKDGSNQSSECTVTVKNTMYAVTSAEKMESPHGYENNCSDIWVYTDENAEDSLEVVFDERTEVEDGFDFIYIYSADGTQIGKYTGTQLSGATVEVPGNTVKIKLVSDKAGNAWGFKVKSIHAASGRLPQKISGAGAYTKVYGDSRFLLDCQITEGNGTLSYVTDNGGVASADEKGYVTIHGAGTATVTATASMTADYRKTEKRITITVNRARQNLTVSSETNEIHAGQSLKLHVVSKTGVLHFSSDKEEVVKVDQEGNAVGQAAGTANITVTAVGNKNYLEETKQITISVTAASKKRDNTIRADNITKTYSAKVRKVNIGAKAEGGAKLSYVSNNKSVKVDSGGKITIAKKFIGKAKITIRSASTQNYNAASKTIEITVNPSGTSIRKVKNTGKKKATVYWKKSGAVTGYEIQYSANKKFKSGVRSKTVKKKGTVKLVLPKLKKRKTYFVRIRTYKTVSKEKYYSSWSKAKSVKIKR